MLALHRTMAMYVARAGRPRRPGQLQVICLHPEGVYAQLPNRSKLKSQYLFTLEPRLAVLLQGCSARLEGRIVAHWQAGAQCGNGGAVCRISLSPAGLYAHVEALHVVTSHVHWALYQSFHLPLHSGSPVTGPSRRRGNHLPSSNWPL